ncbi:MAG: DUF6462 family protein [Lachnospiraceae bacterium]|nr:DUF6462 family protein [Lachnospiraceae bacterium]
MKERTRENRANYSVRLMDITQLCAYIGLGQVTARKFAADCGAVMKIGRRCLYDKVIIDKYIDGMGANSNV